MRAVAVIPDGVRAELLGPLQEVGIGPQLGFGDQIGQPVAGLVRITPDQHLGDLAGFGEHLGIVQHSQQLQGGAATGLGGTQHIALAALFQVDLCQFEPITGGRHGCQTLIGRGRAIGVGDQQADPGKGAAAHSSTQLMQLATSMWGYVGTNVEMFSAVGLATTVLKSGIGKITTGLMPITNTYKSESRKEKGQALYDTDFQANATRLYKFIYQE